jgi:hypothetical protein
MCNLCHWAYLCRRYVWDESSLNTSQAVNMTAHLQRRQLGGGAGVGVRLRVRVRMGLAGALLRVGGARSGQQPAGRLAGAVTCT